MPTKKSTLNLQAPAVKKWLKKTWFFVTSSPIYSAVVFWLLLAFSYSALAGCFGKYKDIFHPLPELETLVSIQDQRVNEFLLTTACPMVLRGR
jgi:hypothetical protein